jgi:hypothetical protein
LGFREETVGENFKGAGQEVGSGVKGVGKRVKEAVDPESKPTTKEE